MKPDTESHTPWRLRLGRWIAKPGVEQALIGLILVNAVILGLETFPTLMKSHGRLLKGLDAAILGVFIVELTLRITAHGWRFFRDPWSLFDFTVIAIALVPASGPLAVLRTLRVLRVLRILTLMPSMRRVVTGLISAIPGLSSVLMLMGLIFYVSAVVATGLFGDQFPQWFGHLGETAYTLFQVMTLESWSMGIARPVLEAYPFAWVFFVIFILVTTFTMLNLFIAVIVNANQAEHDLDTAQHIESEHRKTRDEIRALAVEIDTLKTLLNSRQS
ncbi:MAG: ion transporter [Granulosicoccus sp.]|nr:ion transporter [Granulosicoccus sp.]